MKAVFIALAALPVLAGQPASAESPFAKRWLETTAEDIGARVQTPAPGTVVLRATVGGARRFDSVEVAGTSGSPALDRAVLEAARKRLGETPPSELLGRVVLLRVTPTTELAEVNRGAIGPR